MSAADDPKRNDSSVMRKVRMLDGETRTVTYRQAVGLVSIGRAEWADLPKAKKSSVSTPARKGQEGAEAGNKPPSGPSADERS